MERREFCRLLGIGTLATCAGGLSGCARALRWSETQREQVTTREFSGPSSPEGGAAGPSYPDLAIVAGDDPAMNTRMAVAMLGGLGRFVKPGARVVIKPNVLTAREPEYAVTTNPQAVAAMVEMCWEAGARSVSVMDRPTSPAVQAYKVSGLQMAVGAVDGRMKILSKRDFERISIPRGRLLSSWPLLVDVFEADVTINMPIAKTHGLAGLTMAMKNLMGVMGGERGTIHQDFHQKIVDVNTLIRPQLTVLDAYRILIRNGPTGGGLEDVRLARTCIAGTDPVSVDAYGATLFGMKGEDLPYLRLASEQGLGVVDLSQLRLEKRGA